MTREVRMHDKAAARLADAAIEALVHVRTAVLEAQPADHALAGFFRGNRQLGSRDRRFIADLVFSHFRWLGWTSRACGDDLRTAAFCAWMLDAARPHPAATQLGARANIGAGRATPVGDLPLNAKADAFAAWTPRATKPSVTDLAPDWLSSILYVPQGTEAREHAARCVEAFQRRPPAWVRLSSKDAEPCLSELAAAGAQPARHTTLQDAVALGGAFAMQALECFRNGGVEVQDLASQCVGLVCDPRPGQRWWDACSGSGGKTLHLAHLMRDTGRILATDVRPGILGELSRRVSRSRLGCVEPRLMADVDAVELRDAFDGVLVDAPCSGIGTWARNPDARWRIRPDFVARQAAVQRELLDHAATAVKRGGQLVYSVCTVTRAESVEIVERFLREHPEFKPGPIVHPLTGEEHGGAIWVWPWDGPCDGMFIAAFRRA